MCIIQNEYFYERNKFIHKTVEIHGELIRIQAEILKRYKCRQADSVRIEITFITDLKYATYNDYFQLPKPMIKRKICQKIDRNPNLIKTLDCMPEPYTRHIIIKHWGYSLRR